MVLDSELVLRTADHKQGNDNVNDYLVALKLKLFDIESELREAMVMVNDTTIEEGDLYDLRTSSRYGYDASFRDRL
jgi:hypothetical protein